MMKKRYDEAREKIERECNQVRGQVDITVDSIIDDLKSQKRKLYKEIELVKKDLLFNLNEQYENFDFHKVDEIDKTPAFPNPNDKIILDSLNSTVNETSAGSVTSKEKVSFLTPVNHEDKDIIEKKINSLNQSVLDSLNRTTIEFNKNKTNLDISLIGELNYDIQSDLLTKIKHLNNSSYVIKADLTPLVDYKNIVKKKFGLLSRNKIVIMFERYFGQVSFLFLHVIYVDGTVIASNQISGIWSFHGYYIYNKHILIALRLRKDSYKIYLYNEKLELVKEMIFEYELKKIFMNSNEIILLTHEKSLKFAQHLAHVFNYELQETGTFGQTKHPKRNFYVPGNILAISSDKIYSRIELNKEIVIMDKRSCKRLKSFISPGNIQNLMLDTKSDRLIMYRFGNELEMFDETGSLIIKNALQTQGLEFEECRLIESGSFCFINSQMNYLVVI